MSIRFRLLMSLGLLTTFGIAIVATGRLAAADTPANIPAGMDMPPGIVARFATSIEGVWGILGPIFRALPSVPGELATVLGRIVASSPSAGLRDILVGIVSFLVLTLLIPTIGTFRPKVPPEATDKEAFAHILRRFVRIVLLSLSIIITAIVLHELVFGHETLAENFAISLVDAGVRFVLAMAVPFILLSPGESRLRLMPCDDRTVARMMPRIAVAVGLAVSFIAVVPILLNAGMQWPTSQALALLVGASAALIGYDATRCFINKRKLTDGQKRTDSLWRAVSLGAALLFVACWSYGVIRLDFAFFDAVVASGIIVTLAFAFDRVLIAAQKAAELTEDNKRRSFHVAVSAALRRGILAAALLGLIVVAARWAAATFVGTAYELRLGKAETAVQEAALTIACGFVLFEIVTTWIGSKFVQPKISIMPGEDEEFSPVSRLSTVVPLLKGAVAITILGVTGLVAISKLGVDITPVLAGAGILGLAISFGSQSLVRDVVAGIFYIADDAFRIGEYIEATRLKGTVEKISLRSMRLRHHNGHIHTIPFGQLGFVTNFS
ncbi:MAG: mechanosensitive ion channel family protein, partial [Beijerinckiaceae bacterium]